MSVRVEETPPDLPDGMVIAHYPVAGIEGPEWETIVTWCGLYLDHIRGSDRNVNYVRLRQRMRNWQN